MGNSSGISRGDRNRNTRLARLRAYLGPPWTGQPSEPARPVVSWDVTKNIVRPGSAQPQTTAPPSLADTDETAVAALERKARRQPINHTKIMAYAALITT